jgi:UDP-glucose 4-epimerase
MLARAAVAAGVRRFVFASSVKACGEEKDTVYREEDRPAPEDIYGQSKLQAEQELAELSRLSDIEVVVLRLPLVYGPYVRANFLRMMRLVDREMPLPFAAIGNRRSLIGLDNLASAIALCLEHPRAAGRLYFVSDQADVSTPALLGKLATALGRRSFLIPVPRNILALGASLFGAEESFRRLTGSLAVDSSRISKELNWRPVISLEEGFARTAHWYKSEHNSEK